jgi:hypothetical protein
MNQTDIIETVEELEIELYDLNHELSDNGMGYQYITNGMFDSVTFCEQCIYCSETDSETDIEKAGGFKEYLIQQRDRFIDMLVKVKEENVTNVYSGSGEQPLYKIITK